MRYVAAPMHHAVVSRTGSGTDFGMNHKRAIPTAAPKYTRGPMLRSNARLKSGCTMGGAGRGLAMWWCPLRKDTGFRQSADALATRQFGRFTVRYRCAVSRLTLVRQVLSNLRPQLSPGQGEDQRKKDLALINGEMDALNKVRTAIKC